MPKIDLLDFLIEEKIDNIHEDESSTLIPLSNKEVFKTFFTNNPHFLKMFLIDVLKLDLNYEEVETKIYNKIEEIETFKNTTIILISINTDLSLIVKLNYKTNKHSNPTVAKIYNLELNTTSKSLIAEDILVQYSIKRNIIIDNYQISYLEFLQNYYALYQQGVKNKDTIWLTALTTQTYKATYDVLLNAFEKNVAKEILFAIHEANELCYEEPILKIIITKK